MADEPDGVNEALSGAVRVALTVAGRAGEELARHVERTAREAQLAHEQHARQLQQRLAAECAAARAALAPTGRDGWWDRAQPDAIAAVWRTARGWEAIGPTARAAADRFRREVRTRYDMQPDALLAPPASQSVGPAPAERRRRTHRDVTEASDLVDAADRGDRAHADRAEHIAVRGRAAGRDAAAAGRVPAGVGRLDTPQRREALADALAEVADPETVAARVLADVSQARPPQDAVAPAVAPAARPATAAAGRVRQEPAVDR